VGSSNEHVGVIDTSERSGEHTGQPQRCDQRLFMRLLVYRVAGSERADAVVDALAETLSELGCPSVIYRDLMDPRGLGWLTWSSDAVHFVTTARDAIQRPSLAGLTLREEFSMFGRSYATGYEPDLRFALLERPVQAVLSPNHPWAVWYPLRRHGTFERLSREEQAHVLREHAVIGRAYGEQGLATDVRLACHGLDSQDNEFVIGLVGADLHPLSHLIQRMRKTRQTSEYIARMGPFFMGHVAWRLG
jgi:chlorite dismutase